jgi:hypothetical protein
VSKYSFDLNTIREAVVLAEAYSVRAALSSAVQTKTSIVPIAIEGSTNGTAIRSISYEGELTVRLPHASDIHAEVDPKALRLMLNGIRGDVVELWTTSSQLNVAASGFRAKLPLHQALGHSTAGTGQSAPVVEFEVAPEDFARMAAAVAPFVAKGKHGRSPILEGIAFYLVPDTTGGVTLTAISTNSICISRYQTEVVCPNPPSDMIHFVLPTYSVALLARMASKSEDTICIQVLDRRVRASLEYKNAQVDMAINKLQGSYPNAAQYLAASDYVYKIHVDRIHLSELLAAFNTLAGETSAPDASVKESSVSVGTYTDNNIYVITESRYGVTIRRLMGTLEICQPDITTENVEFALSPARLLQAVRIASGETVTLALVKARVSTILQLTGENDNFKFVLALQTCTEPIREVLKRHLTEDKQSQDELLSDKQGTDEQDVDDADPLENEAEYYIEEESDEYDLVEEM